LGGLRLGFVEVFRVLSSVWVSFRRRRRRRRIIGYSTLSVL
jgi:hypothetical protein